MIPVVRSYNILIEMFASLGRAFFATSKFLSYKDVLIKNSEITKQFSRSSGPGGQSVNTTNSKAEVRLPIKHCSVVDETILKNLYLNYPNYINKSGELIVTCQVHRSQPQNMAGCIEKLQKMIFNCSKVQGERKYEIPPETDEMERNRIDEKRRKSEIKRKRTGPSNHRDF